MKSVFAFTLFSGIFLSLFFASPVPAQTPVGILPVRMKIADSPPSLFTAVWYMQMGQGGIEPYEEKYFPMVIKGIKEGWSQPALDIRQLTWDDLSKEDRLEEEAFYNKMLRDFPIYLVENSPALFKSKNLPKSDVSAGPMANQYADLLDCDLLVYISIVGYDSVGPTKEAAWAEDARGNLTIAGMIIDGNTGKILEDVEVKMTRKESPFDPPRKKFSEKKLLDLGRKFGQRLANKLQKRL